MKEKKNTIVYIDGFNLYYGALRGSSYKWLDMKRLCELLMPNNHIIKIKYFTAHVSGRQNDPDAPVRQQTYLRALRTIKNLEIHLGHFLSHVVSLPLADPVPGKNPFAKVIKTEEKGSDVNIASHLLFDAFKGQCDVMAVVSNDSDLYTPMRMLRDDFKKVVGFINPHAENPRSQKSIQLSRVASFYKPIRMTALQRCQFPPVIEDENGRIHKPSAW